MKKTISINIGGINFHIDEDAYGKLGRYLDAIRSHFQGIEGRDEVMTDIEARIAELLSQKMTGTKEVITIEDVEQVIRVMGQPSDFAPEDEEAGPTEYVRFQKRLYRDPQKKVIGGVCSGIGAYFNLDPLWIRLLFILLLAAPGFGLLLYIILWLVVPEARTAAERLEMRGRPVTVSALEQSVRHEMGDLKDKVNEMAGKARETYTRKKDAFVQQDRSYVAENFRSVGRFLLRVLAILAGILIFLLAASLTLSFLFILFRIPGITIAEHVELGFFPLFPFLSMLFENDADLRTFGVGVIILVAIPLLLLMLAGLRIVFKIPSIRYFNGAAGWIWFLTLIITVIFGFKVASSFRNEGETVREQVLDIPGVDTLNLMVSSSLPSGTAWDYQRTYMVPEWGIYLSDYNDTIYGIPQLRITESRDSSIYLEERYFSRGRSRAEALENAGAILYGWILKGDSLSLHESFSLAPGQQWRNQEVFLELRLPEGLIFKTDDNLSKITTGMRGMSRREMNNNILIMTEHGVHEFEP